MIDWENDGERRAELERLYRSGMSFSKIAKAMNLSRGCVSGAIHRVVLKAPDTRKLARPEPQPKSKCWTEATLTEKWADRKARRARERAEAERAQRA